MAQVITSQEFDSKVLQANAPVLVDFFATWCGPCKMLAVYKVDIDQSLDLAQRYGIMSVPTLMVFEGGQVKRTAMGAQPKANVLALLD